MTASSNESPLIAATSSLPAIEISVVVCGKSLVFQYVSLLTFEIVILLISSCSFS